MVSVDGNNISSNALGKASKVGNISQEQDSEQQKLEIRKAAAQNISIAYDNAINTLKQYQGNQGILNAGFYREKLGQFLKNNNITDIKLCCDTAIKTLEQEKEFATNRLEYVANHEGDFKREFKEFTGKEYDEDAMKEFLVNASNGEDWTASYEKAYNVEKTDKNGNVSYENKIVNNALKKVKYQEYIDGAADIVIMLLGTGLISKGLGKGVGAIGKKISPYIPKVLKNISAKGLMKVGGNKVTVGAVLGAMAMQSATFSIWDASKNYINLKTKDIQLSGEDAANEWAAYKQGNIESAKFGAFAGLLSSTVVGKVVAGTTKLLEKPVSHAVTKNLVKTLDKSSSLTGKDIMQTFLTKQSPGVVANSAGMLAEISGFTMYETANEVTKELLKKDENGERHLPKDLTEEGLAKYLWKHFKGQATNLAEIKAISKLIFMHKGTADIRNNIIKDNLSKCETLNNIKVEKKTDNGKTSFELTMPDGSKSNVLTMEEVIAKCNVFMQFDMASNIKPSTNNEESVTPDNEQTPQDFDPTKTVLSATVRHDSESATGHSSKNNISTKLQNAITRSDFVAIRNEILKMPNSPERVKLFESYLKTYQDWSTRRVNGNDPNQYTDKPNMAVKNMAEGVDKTLSQSEIIRIFNDTNLSDEQADQIFKDLQMTDRDISRMRWHKDSKTNKIAAVLKHLSENSDMRKLESNELKNLIAWYIDENNIGIASQLLTSNNDIDIFNTLGNIRYRNYNSLGPDSRLNEEYSKARIEATQEILNSGKPELLAEILPQINSENKNDILNFYLKTKDNNNFLTETITNLKTLYPDESGLERFCIEYVKTPEHANVLNGISKTRFETLKDILEYMDSSPEIAKQFSEFASKDINLLLHSKADILNSVIHDKADLNELLNQYIQEDNVVKQYLNLKNVDFKSHNLNQDESKNIKEIISLCKKSNTELNLKNMIFVDNANKAMQANLHFSDSKSFIPEILKEIKPEEQNDFLSLIEYSNQEVKKAIKENPYTNNGLETEQTINKIVKLYKEYPKEVLTLINKKMITSKYQETNQFNINDITKLAPVMKEYPQEVSTLINKKMIYSTNKFNIDDITELAQVMKEYPEEVSALINETMMTSGEVEVPRFNNNEIKHLAPAINKYPKETSTLLKEKIINNDGQEQYRFNGYAIIQLAPLYNKYPEEVSALLKERKVNNYDKSRFDTSEIVQLAPVMNKYPKEVSTLLKETFNNKKEKMSRLDGDEISQLAPVMNEYPKEVSALLKETKITNYGQEVHRYDGNEIIQLAPVMNKYPEEVSALSKEKRIDTYGREQLRFNGNGISKLAPVMNKYPKTVSALINEKDVNSDGVETPKFSAKDIGQFASIKDFDLEVAKEQIDKQLETTKAHPEKYINGEYPNEQEMLDDIDWFFNRNQMKLLKASAVFDKEALNHLLRMRLDDAGEYLYILDKLPDLNFIKQLSNSTNIDGKAFMPTQKVEFIDLLSAYKENKLETTKIEQMAQGGKIDLAQLNIDLFNKIMKNSGLTDDEIASIPKEKLIAWDMKYTHLLSKEIAEEKDPAFSDLLRAANLEPDFNKYIHDTNNPYGQTNANTKAMYQENNMNYETWIKPSKENEVHFVSKDKNTEQLNQIASQVTEDINTLMKTPVKGFLKKQYTAKFFKGDEFVIPQEYLASKSKLTELVKQLSDTSEQGQLTQVWKRAKGNSTNPDPNRAQTARNTLTILDHLTQRLDDLSKIQDGKATKTLDLTIKMWDRNPQKDIFQGNYSTCCIGMGGGNGSAMPYYIMDTAYNMIELVDNTTGKTIGNALCYMVKGENGKPSFIVDNIEINNGEKPSDEACKQIRTSITEYASKISKDVTGSDEVPIYLGGQYNDVPINDLPTSTEKVQFIGDVNREDIYMDLYTGWIDKEMFTNPYQVELWKLK